MAVSSAGVMTSNPEADRLNTMRPRARDLGISFGEFTPGPFNAITDVEGVRVGHTTLIEGEGPLRVGKGPVRTGVTVILPHSRSLLDEPVEAAHFIFNGAGTTAGLSLIDEFGQIETPIVLTNTFSVGTVYDAIVRHAVQSVEDPRKLRWFSPTVGETYDGGLNDAAGLHVKAEHVFEAIERAVEGSVLEGNVGAGTGTSACGFKAGIGTASRIVETSGKRWTLAALVQSNFGGELVIQGVPVGRILKKERPPSVTNPDGSIMVVLGTDVPLSSRQLGRLAKRGTWALPRVGAEGSHGSGDYFIAFSTTYRQNLRSGQTRGIAYFMEDESRLNPLFRATVDMVEEAILNSFFKAETMKGRDDRVVEAIPIDRVIEILTDYRVIPPRMMYKPSCKALKDCA